MAEPIRYQTTGALLPGSPTYVRRAADDDLWEHLETGEFCYVLAPRQMGKSSLLWQTVGRLREAGVCVATANIQGMGDSRSEDEFYEGVVEQLVTNALKNSGFEMPFEWSEWWGKQTGPLAQRFVKFIREAFLQSTSETQRWVIAIDEIDATITLPFTDSFFTAIRSCHDARPGEPLFRRLSFVLLGVATPDALIKDRTRTPFNVGRQVDLCPFSDEEALPLAKGLPLSDSLNLTALRQVMSWTAGQPHLTQDACDALAKSWRKEPRPTTEAEVQQAVEALIASRYLNAATRGDNAHFDYIEKRRVAEFPKKTQLLRTYIRTLQDSAVTDNRESGIAAELKISGLTRRDSRGFLQVANRIYATVFNERWARANIPNNWPVIRAVAVGVVALLLALGSEYGYRRPEAYATQLAEASGDLELARKNYIALQSFPLYGGRAATLWGEFQERRFQQAVAMDEQAIEAASRERQAAALELATSAREELDACPGEKWKPQAKTLWENFHKQRLLAAIKLDEASWVAFDNLANLPNRSIDDAKDVLIHDADDAGKLRLQEAQRNAYGLAQQAHAAFKQPEAMAQFYDRRAERAEAHEHLEAGVLWRLASLKQVDAPKNRRAVTHLIGPDYAPLVRTWGRSVPNQNPNPTLELAELRMCQLFKNETRLLLGAGNELKVCDFESGDVLETLRHNSDIKGAVISPEESHVLTWARDGAARVWEFGSNKPLATIRHPEPIKDDGQPLRPDDTQAAKGAEKQPPPQITKAMFGTSGRLILTVGDDQTARLWDALKSKLLQTFKHPGNVTGALLNKHESRVLTWSDLDDTTQLWDVTKPEPLQIFKHDLSVVGALFSQDESRVLTWSDDKTARLWDVTKPDPLQTFKHNQPVIGALFSRDESRVLTWSSDQTARLWDAAKSESLQTFKHDQPVIGALFSKDESRVLTWSAEPFGWHGEARLWDVTQPEPLQTFKHDSEVTGALFSRDESRVLTWSGNLFGQKGEARLWDVTKPVPLHTFKHDAAVNVALFSRDESRVLTWSFDTTARLWDVTQTAPLQTFKHDDRLIGSLFSRDESRMLTWSFDGTAQLWDVTQTKPLQTFQHHGPARGASFSRDELRVLTWSDDKYARLWNVSKPEPIQTFEHNDGVRGASFSQYESRVLTCSGNAILSVGEARLWDVSQSEPLRTFKHDNSVLGASFIQNESRVLTWSFDRSARLWDVTKTDPIQTFRHDGPVLGAAISRDGARVLTWSSDETARLWDVIQLNSLQTFKHGSAVSNAEFMEDSSRLVTRSANWLHQLPLGDDTVRHARRVAGGILNKPSGRSHKQPFSVARAWPSWSEFSIQSVSWADYAEPPIPGDPAKLLRDWQDKLGQRIDEVGEVRVLRPLPVRRRE